MSDEAELISQVVGVLESMRIPYVIGGSIALAVWAAPRLTHDLDLVLDLPEDRIQEFCEHFTLDRYFLDSDSMRSAFERRNQPSLGMYSFIDLNTGLKVDLFPLRPNDLPQQAALKRSITTEVLEGLAAAVYAPDDLLIQKLRWCAAGESFLSAPFSYRNTPANMTNGTLCYMGLFAMLDVPVTTKPATTLDMAGEPANQVRAAGKGLWQTWRGVYALLFPKPFDMVSSLLYMGALGLFFYDGWAHNYGRGLEWIPSLIVTTAILALLALERWDCWFYAGSPPARPSAIIFVSRMVLIEIVAQLDGFSFSPFLYLVIPFSGFLYRGMRLCYMLAALVLVVYLAKLFWYIPNWYTSVDIAREFLIFAVGLLFVITMAQVVGSEQRSRARSEMLLSQLEESHRQLRAYAAQVGDLAATKERNRLARDIHDSLGHYLTVINVQLEKALAFKEAQPEESNRAVSDAKRLASEALHDVRRSVGALRGVGGRELGIEDHQTDSRLATPDPLSSFSLKRALEELVEHTTTSELAIDLKVTGSEDGFAGQGLIALYRAAQEGLTNVQKHAGANTAVLEVEFHPEEATLYLCDNGRGIENSPKSEVRPPTPGYGLLGIEERVELLGGSFHIESAPDKGTCLHMTVPRAGRPVSVKRET